MTTTAIIAMLCAALIGCPLGPHETQADIEAICGSQAEVPSDYTPEGDSR